MRWIIILSILLALNTVFASPEITTWYNNKTADDSLDIAINAEDTVFFNVSANEIVNWTWILDGVEQNTDQDTNQSNWTYTFPSYGTYHVNVSGSNIANGSTGTVNWTVASTLNFTDALGNDISITKKPEKIVSLAPGNTEILFALGLGDRVVGVTSYCDYPPEALNKEKVGGFYNPSVELVVNLTPDLILAYDGNPINVVNTLIEECENLNCTVVGLEAKTIDEIIENIKLVGKIADVNAENLVLEITQRISAVESNTGGLSEDQKLKVLYIIWYPDLWTAGSGTFVDDVIQKAGGKNIASDLDGWKIINSEVVLSRNPEVIICSGMGLSGVDTCNNIKNDDRLKSVYAVVSNQLYVIGDPNIIERPGPRIASGLETIYAFLNFSVKSPPQQQSSSDGGSSPPPIPTVTASDGKAVVTLPSIGAGTMVSVQIPDAQDVDVTEISIKAKSSVSWVKITIKSSDSHPSDVPIPNGETYRYLEIDKKNIEDENIAELIIKFKVERTWIADNEVDQETIKLKRYNNGQWDELLTSKSKEDPTYLYYTANSSGLSYFAITGEKLVLLPTTSAPVETSPPVTTPAPTLSPTTMPTERLTMFNTPTEVAKKKGIYGPTTMALIGTLSIILYILLKKKKLL